MAENINITPDMINNLVNMLKNSSSNNETGQSENNESTKTSDNSSDFSNSFKNFSSNSFDIDTIMKIKSIMEALNSQDDPDSKLLYSLKPYLRKSRQAKLEQYINVLKISRVSKIFKKNND